MLEWKFNLGKHHIHYYYVVHCHHLVDFLSNILKDFYSHSSFEMFIKGKRHSATFKVYVYFLN